MGNVNYLSIDEGSTKEFIISLDNAKAQDSKKTGGKASSLAKLKQLKGVKTQGGFVVTIDALRMILNESKINKINQVEKLSKEWIKLEKSRKKDSGINESIKAKQVELLHRIEKLSQKVREKISEAEIPREIKDQIEKTYSSWCKKKGYGVIAAVRSSGEAEDIGIEAFAGAYDTFINIKGIDDILKYTKLCWASLFNFKAIKNRNDAQVLQLLESSEESMCFSHKQACLAVVIQELVMEPPVSFICFSIDPSTGRPGIRIDATYGYGEGLVGGELAHDSWFLSPDGKEILERKIGNKTTKKTLSKNENLLKDKYNPKDKVSAPCLCDEEIREIAEKIIYLKKNYNGKDIDCEGALNDRREIIFLQSRPETKYSRNIEIKTTTLDENKIPSNTSPLFKGGICGSSGAVSGIIQYISSPNDFEKVKPGVILVTPRTDHKWTPKLGYVKGVITDVGSMTDHAAITARAYDIPALVGTENATNELKQFDGKVVTLDASSLCVYSEDLPIKNVTELREIWLETPEPAPLSKTIEELWKGANKAGQTVIDQEGKRWIGRPMYPLKALQLDIYNKAFDLIEKKFETKLRRKTDGNILYLNFEDNCQIDRALGNLSIDELEAINKEKEKIAEEFLSFAERFEPTRKSVEKFIWLYTRVNFYMDIGYQFNEACDRLMNEHLRFVTPAFRGDFLKAVLPYKKTEAMRMNEDFELLVSHARKNFKKLFESSSYTYLDNKKIIEKQDATFYKAILRLIESYKNSKLGLGTSHLSINRPFKNFMQEFSKLVISERKDKHKEPHEESEDVAYNIKRAFSVYPNLKRVLHLAVRASHITEDMHHFKARGQWPISDGLYRLGARIKEKGLIERAEDIFNFKTDELMHLFEEPILEISEPMDVSVLIMEKGWLDDALKITEEISLGEQLRIDASIYIKDFEHIAKKYAAALKEDNTTTTNDCLSKGKDISNDIRVQLWSNISGKWEDKGMTFTGFSGNNFRFKIVLTPKFRGSFSYTVRCRTIYQDMYLPTQPHKQYGRIIVKRRINEKIMVNLDEAEDILNNPDDKKEILDKVRNAAKQIQQWQEEKRLGYRSLPEQPPDLIKDIIEYTQTRIEKGISDIILIGIGGQASPNRTLQEALRPDLYNSFQALRGSYPRIHVIENLDATVLQKHFKQEGLDPRFTDVCIASKSGKTLETLVNGYFFIDWLLTKLDESEALKHIVVISNDSEPSSGELNDFFNNKNVKKYYIPTRTEDVGGRFSTFAPSGLITAAYAGIDIQRLLEGARNMKKSLYDMEEDEISIDNIKRNKALMAALLAFSYLDKKKDILIVSTFSSKLRAAADFLRQLLGESLPKDGKGPFPIIVTGENTLREVIKSDQDKFFLLFNYLTDDSLLPDIKPHAGLNINIPELDEFTCGELIYLFEEIVVWYGALLGINPLIQPKVQLSKDITQKELEAYTPRGNFTDSIELLDEAVYGKNQLSEADVRATLLYLSMDEDSTTEAYDIPDEIDELLTCMSQFSSKAMSRKITRYLILGSRELILKVRGIHDAFYSDLSYKYSEKNINLPSVEFIDETRVGRLREFISCADPEATLVQVMLSDTDTEIVNRNLRTIVAFMKDVPQNIIFTADYPKMDISTRLERYIGSSKTFFPINKNHCNYINNSGFTANDFLALTLFGMDPTDIKEMIRGYVNYPDDIAKKLSAYSYLLYQRKDLNSCNVNILFSYSDRFKFFNSWAKHRYREKFGDVQRGPNVDSAIGSTDQHAIMEGMLNWKNSLFTIFINVENTPSRSMAPQDKRYASKLVPSYAHNRNVHDILVRMHKGVSSAFRESSRPNVTINLPRLNYKNYGALLAIIEMASNYERKLFKRDIDEEVPPRVLPVVSAIRYYTEVMELDTGEIDKELYYHYSIIRKLYNYKDAQAIKMIAEEMCVTNRSFREVVCGVVGIKSRPQKTKTKKSLVTDTLYLGGGGFGACSITRGLLQRYIHLPETIRDKLPQYAVSTITTAYDDWGNSRQIMDMFLKFWRIYIPAVGDPAAVLSWLTIPEEGWFDQHREEGFKPENINPKMDLVYSNKNRITLTDELDTLEKFIIHRIEVLNNNPDFIKPPDWHFFIANIVDIARLFDREFVSMKRVNFRQISGQNLITMGGLIDSGYVREREVKGDPDLERTMEVLGIRNAYVIPVSFDQANKGAMIVGCRGDGSELFGQYNITTMERKGRIEYITLKKVERDRFGRIMGTAGLRQSELPEISPQARELIENARSVIISGAGSSFTSITAPLLTMGVVEALQKRKDIPRVFILPPMDEPETYGHSVKTLIQAMEKSIQTTLNDASIKFQEIFDFVIIPNMPENIKTKYRNMIKEDRSVYLNQEGKKRLRKAKSTEEMIDIVRNEKYQNEETIKGLELGFPKLDKILPANPFTITAEDYKFLNSRTINILKVSLPDAFFIWEGKIAYRPDTLINTIENVKIRHVHNKFDSIPGFAKNFQALVDIFGSETKAFDEVKKEALSNDMTIVDVVCGSIARENGTTDEFNEVKFNEIAHLSFGGGGWHTCSLMRAMAELPQESKKETIVAAAHLVPTVDNGGHGRVLGDEARRNIDMYVPIFGDFAGVTSWLSGKWDSENTFADVTSNGVKMDLLYRNRFNGDRLVSQVIDKLRELEDKIESGKYQRPNDWIAFISNILNLTRFLDDHLIQYGKLGLKKASCQNLTCFAAMLDSGVQKVKTEKDGITKSSLDRKRNFSTRLFKALGIENVALQFQTYDQACLVALLEGCILKIGNDALLLRRIGDTVIAVIVERDSVGNFITTPLTNPLKMKKGQTGTVTRKLKSHSIVIRKGSKKNEIQLSIDDKRAVFKEGKEGETIVYIKNKNHPANLDGSWTPIIIGDIPCEVMSRRIEGQFAISMDEHVSRIEKISLKTMRPKRNTQDMIVYNENTGWIDYEVSDLNAKVTATVWAEDFISRTKKSIRFDSGGALTSQIAALLNKGIARKLKAKKSIPKIYIPPLTRDISLAGLGLESLIDVIERSMIEALGDQKIRFQDIFSHIVLPDVPLKIQNDYLSLIKNKAQKQLNYIGLSKIKKVTEIEAIRSILKDDANLNKQTQDDLYKDLAKTKAKRKKMLPQSLFPVTEDDKSYIRKRGIEIVKIRDEKYFGIWENKIVYEPRNMRDLIIHISENQWPA